MFDDVGGGNAERVSGQRAEPGALPAPSLDAAAWLTGLDTSVGGLGGLAGLLDAVLVAERHAAWLASVQARLLAVIQQADQGLRVAEAAAEAAADTAAGLRPQRPGWVDERDRHWICEELGLILRSSAGSALSRMYDADQLVRRLPDALALLQAGRLHPVQARRLVEATQPLTARQSAAVAARVLPRAPGQSIAGFCRCLRRAVLAAAPQTAEQAHTDAINDRRVVISPDDHGMASLWALLPAPQLLWIHDAINTHAHRYRNTHLNDPRTGDQHRADALIDLITLGATTATTTATAGQHPAASTPPASTPPGNTPPGNDPQPAPTQHHQPPPAVAGGAGR